MAARQSISWITPDQLNRAFGLAGKWRSNSPGVRLLNNILSTSSSTTDSGTQRTSVVLTSFKELKKQLKTRWMYVMDQLVDRFESGRIELWPFLIASVLVYKALGGNMLLTDEQLEMRYIVFMVYELGKELEAEQSADAREADAEDEPTVAVHHESEPPAVVSHESAPEPSENKQQSEDEPPVAVHQESEPQPSENKQQEEDESAPESGDGGNAFFRGAVERLMSIFNEQQWSCVDTLLGGRLAKRIKSVVQIDDIQSWPGTLRENWLKLFSTYPASHLHLSDVYLIVLLVKALSDPGAKLLTSHGGTYETVLLRTLIQRGVEQECRAVSLDQYTPDPGTLQTRIWLTQQKLASLSAIAGTTMVNLSGTTMINLAVTWFAYRHNLHGFGSFHAMIPRLDEALQTACAGSHEFYRARQLLPDAPIADLFVALAVYTPVITGYILRDLDDKSQALVVTVMLSVVYDEYAGRVQLNSELEKAFERITDPLHYLDFSSWMGDCTDFIFDTADQYGPNRPEIQQYVEIIERSARVNPHEGNRFSDDEEAPASPSIAPRSPPPLSPPPPSPSSPLEERRRQPSASSPSAVPPGYWPRFLVWSQCCLT